jgi:PAS domain S-box-containing protein
MSAKEPPPSAPPLENRLSETENALAENQWRLELAIETSHAGLWDWNLVTQECHYSTEWKSQIGQAGDVLSNQFSEWEDRLHPEDHDRVMEELKACLAKPAGRLYLEYRLRHKDGTHRWIHARGRIKRADTGQPLRLLACQVDITERRALEAQFQQAQKMEVVSRLARGVAHDFNNLLTIVLGYSDMLLSGPALDEPTRDSLAEIKKAGERAFSLTRQLLTFSRKQPLEPALLDLNQVVGDCEKMLKRLVGEDVELVTNLEPNPGQVKADAGQLEQVLLNLAIHARDTMPQGGKLTIETAPVSLGEAYCRLHPEVKPGRYVLLAVSDTGEGLDEDAKARMLDPLFTGREEGQETGLGLAMVFSFVKQSGGHVSLLSDPGQGCSFKIHLPEAEAMPDPDAAAGAQELASGSETILLVEDEEDLRKLIRQVLQSRGYTVLDTGRGDDALVVAQSHPGPIDLLVSDVVLPGMSGDRLAGDMVVLHPGIKTLFISGYADDTLERHGIRPSETALLHKPFSIETLPVKVRQVLDQ